VEIKSSRTVVVLTALDREQRAVRALLCNLRPYHHPAGTVFELDGQAGSVVLAEIGAGNQTAAVIAERAIAEFRARGAVRRYRGSLHEDLDLGTIVVGTKIYGYHGGVDEDGGFRARPQSWESDHGLDQLAREVNRTGSWHSLPPDPAATPPRVVFRAIAAGEVVLNSRQTPLVKQLRGPTAMPARSRWRAPAWPRPPTSTGCRA
jgi:phosphorylase superfamily protein